MPVGSGRRYDRPAQVAKIPGREDSLAIRLPRPGGSCSPDWRLKWVTTGAPSASLDAARKTATGLVSFLGQPVGPWGWLAQIEGERCCCVPEFSLRWEPAIEGGAAPVTVVGADSVAVFSGLGENLPTGAASHGLLTVRVRCGEIPDQVALLIAEGPGASGYSGALASRDCFGGDFADGYATGYDYGFFAAGFDQINDLNYAGPQSTAYKYGWAVGFARGWYDTTNSGISDPSLPWF